jgi:hypothetical protein
MNAKNRTRASLVFMMALALALALASASINAPAQSRTDDREVQCSGMLMGGMVETQGMAYCRGFLGQSCGGGEYASACSEGASDRARRGETGGAQTNQSAIDEMEENRRLVEQLPVLPPDANPLLGRWRKLPAPPPRNVLESLLAMGTDTACTLLAGGGPSFEFRADALLHGTRTMDSMRYYRGNEGVVFALGERYQRLLAFEFDGRDQMTNGPCNFERVGAAASPSPPSARIQANTILAVGPDAGGYSCPDGRQIWVSRCYDQSAQASCQVVHLHQKNNGRNPETAATRAELLDGLRGCTLTPLEFGPTGSISLVK